MIVKWIKRLGLLFFVGLLFSGCRPIILLFLGMKENYYGITMQEARKYYDKYFGKYHRQDFLFDQEAVDTFNKIPYKPGWDGGIGYIQFKMYNKEGRLIAQYQSCEGPRKRNHIMDSFPPGRGLLWPADTTLTINDELKYLRNWDGSKVHLDTPFQTDYVFVTYWVTFTGVPGRHLVRDVEKYIASHPEYSFENYLVSLDKIISE